MLARLIMVLTITSATQAACGGDDDGAVDAALADVALGADSSERLPDAADTTRCGEEPAVLECDRATEICVEAELGGPGILYDCVKLPAGCDADRSCAACSAACEPPADACADTDRDNTISCACIECA